MALAIPSSDNLVRTPAVIQECLRSNIKRYLVHSTKLDWALRFEGGTVHTLSALYRHLDKTLEQCPYLIRPIAAVNVDGRFGSWRYELVEKISDVSVKLTAQGDEMREKLQPFCPASAR